MKPRVLYFGRLAGDLTLERPAFIRTCSRLICTAPVTRILPRQEHRIRFETADRQISVTPEPLGVSFRKAEPKPEETVRCAA